MTPLRSIILIAIVANLLTIVLYNYAVDQPGGTGASLAFSLLWMPTVWISATILTLIAILRGRKKLFIKDITGWAIMILLFCTPIPIFLGYKLTHPTPETLRSSSSYHPKDGLIYKGESWYYSSNYQQKYVDMYFIADSTEELLQGEKAYKKDSTWIYFTKSGDTLKIEKYKSGQLISAKEYAKQ